MCAQNIRCPSHISHFPSHFSPLKLSGLLPASTKCFPYPLTPFCLSTLAPYSNSIQFHHPLVPSCYFPLRPLRSQAAPSFSSPRLPQSAFPNGSSPRFPTPSSPGSSCPSNRLPPPGSFLPLQTQLPVSTFHLGPPTDFPNALFAPYFLQHPTDYPILTILFNIYINARDPHTHTRDPTPTSILHLSLLYLLPFFLPPPRPHLLRKSLVPRPRSLTSFGHFSGANRFIQEKTTNHVPLGASPASPSTYWAPAPPGTRTCTRTNGGPGDEG